MASLSHIAAPASGRLPPPCGDAMLVYIHVPFCRTKCRYCAFHSRPLGAGTLPAATADVRRYRDLLFRELTLWAERLPDAPVESVFFGGGTPSLLPPSWLHEVLDALRHSFALAPEAEISMEANPESLPDARVAQAYLRAGINRLSLGLQALDDAQLRRLGRPHSAADGLRAMAAARDAGCRNLSVDLMWALPGQKTAQWRQTLTTVCRLRPDHVSAYGLTREEGTPLDADCACGRLHLPPDEEQDRMFHEGAALLEAHGLYQYEISNFAHPGRECRHNQGYWEGADYLGMGPAATSTLRGRRWTQPADLNAWAVRLAARTPDADAEWLSPAMRLRETLMLRLRTTRGLPLALYTSLTGHHLTQDMPDLLSALQQAGLATLTPDHLRLTRDGMLVSNAILARFFAETDDLALP